MSTMTIMTMTVSMNIEIKTKQRKHIFLMVLLFRLIVNNFLTINFRFFWSKKAEEYCFEFLHRVNLKVEIEN